MTLLEIDLGQVNTVNSNTQTSKIVGMLEGTNEPIYLMNKPNNNFFIRKEGNTREYTLILTFQKVI